MAESEWRAGPLALSVCARCCRPRDIDLGILSIGLGTRARFDAVATFTLIDIATGSQLFAATTHTGESFDILSNYYSDVVAEEAVRERAAKEISRDIVTQLTAFLQRRAAPAAAVP